MDQLQSMRSVQTFVADTVQLPTKAIHPQTTGAYTLTFRDGSSAILTLTLNTTYFYSVIKVSSPAGVIHGLYW